MKLDSPLGQAMRSGKRGTELLQVRWDRVSRGHWLAGQGSLGIGVFALLKVKYCALCYESADTPTPQKPWPAN